MTDDELQQIRERCEAAQVAIRASIARYGALDSLGYARRFARSDVPLLLAEVERLRAELADAERRVGYGCESPPPGCDCPGCSAALLEKP